ncbi:MAG: hypothetical protein ACLQDY_03735 [Streptosporangiaceae bacterium]
MTGAGQAPGVVKLRLMGSAEDCAAVADEMEPWTAERSAPYPNRRDPGVRVYLTLMVRATQGRPQIGGAR